MPRVKYNLLGRVMTTSYDLDEPPRLGLQFAPLVETCVHFYIHNIY